MVVIVLPRPVVFDVPHESELVERRHLHRAAECRASTSSRMAAEGSRGSKLRHLERKRRSQK